MAALCRDAATNLGFSLRVPLPMNCMVSVECEGFGLRRRVSVERQFKIMKKIFLLPSVFFLLCTITIWGQPPPMGIPGQPPISPNAPTVPHLRKFDLDFPGGTPKALV